MVARYLNKKTFSWLLLMIWLLGKLILCEFIFGINLLSYYAVCYNRFVVLHV